MATNAGGSRVVRFGTMRSQVSASTAVLADGSCIGSLAGLPKETVGVHWPSLLAGSEGTLGVVTAVRLKVVPWYRHTATALIATASLADAVAVLDALRGGVPNLDAVELILPEAMAVVAAHLAATPPVGDDADGRVRHGRARRPRRPDRRPDRGARRPARGPRRSRDVRGPGADRWSCSATASPSRSAPRASRSSSTWPSRSACSTS